VADLLEPDSGAFGASSKPDDRLTRHESRLESLLDAFWLSAMTGDHKSGELCRRLLQQQAELYRLGDSANAPDEDTDDELAKLRARRSG
jgi:hypothetical protein